MTDYLTLIIGLLLAGFLVTTTINLDDICKKLDKIIELIEGKNANR